LVRNIEEFEAWVHDINPDMIGVTESWETSSILDSELALQDHDLLRCDRPVAGEGGGVLLYVKTDLHAVKCSLSNTYSEHVRCYFLDGRKVNCYIGVCYRTPSYDICGSPNHDLLHEKETFHADGRLHYRYTSWPPCTDGNAASRKAVD